MWLRKALAGSAPGYTWESDGAVLEVDDEFACELLDIPTGGFSPADPPTGEVTESPQPDGTVDVAESPIQKRRGRPPKQVSPAELATPVAE